MRITLLQTDIQWASPEANARNAERMMAQAPGSDLYVLPEMWSTGFATMPEGIAEPSGQSLQWMKNQARRTGAAISGSIAICEEDTSGVKTYRNRHYFVTPDGQCHYYDKRHLFGYGGEDKHYTRGECRRIVEYGGCRWLLLTCYDLRFPVWSRYRGDYDAIVIVANWPTNRRAVWDVLLRARAIENQCYVVAANRVGSDDNCQYDGGSAVIDAKGHTVVSCADAEEGTATCEINIEDLRRFRMKFPVLEDRDYSQ